MKTTVNELCDKFRTGSLGRRDFIQRLIVTTGSVLAASHALSTLGFDSSLIQEVRAQESSDRRNHRPVFRGGPVG